MRIDFSEPECSNCYHCRTSAILNTRESEPSNVIGSSVTSMPVSSGPVQAFGHDSASVGSTSTSSPVQPLGHDSAAVGSTSTSSPVQGSSPFSFGSAPAATTCVSPRPAQSLDPKIYHGAFGAPSQRPAFQGTYASGAPPTCIPSTSSAFHSSPPFRFGSAPAGTSVSSAQTQALGPTTFGLGAFAVPTPPRFGSMQAPVQDTSGSVASFTSTSSTSSPVHSSSPFGFAPAVTSVSSAPTQAFGPTTLGFGASAAPTPLRFGSMQAPIQDTSGSVASFTSTSSTSSPVHISSPFGFAPAVTSVSSAPTKAFGFGAYATPTPPRFGSMQAPVQDTFGSGASNTSPSFSFLPFGCIPPPPPSGSSPLFGTAQNMPWSINPFATGCGTEWVRPDVGVLPASSSSSTTTVVFGTTPVSVSSQFGPAQEFPKTTGCGIAFARSGFGSSPASSSFFGPNPWTTASAFGTSTANVTSFCQPAQHPQRDVPKLSSVCASSTQENPLRSFFPGFGVDYLPRTSSSPFGQNPSPLGFNGGTTLLSTSPFSSSPPTGCNPNIGSYLFAHKCSRLTEGSRYPGYTPTPTADGQKDAKYISISASNSYLHKSHEELRWEDYKQGVKGGSFPAAHVSPIGSRPNAFFSPSTTSPSIFASPSVPDQPQKTTFGTTQGNMTGPAFSFPTGGGGFRRPNAPFTGFVPSFQRPHETGFGAQFPSLQRPRESHESANVSSTASGCTACGATSSSSASGHFTFNGATTPLSAGTSLPGLFFPNSGSSPKMFGTNLAAQVTTPALQAYPVQGYILLPFAAMSLQ